MGQLRCNSSIRDCSSTSAIRGLIAGLQKSVAGWYWAVFLAGHQMRERWRKAGKIARQARNLGAGIDRLAKDARIGSTYFYERDIATSGEMRSSTAVTSMSASRRHHE